MKRTVGIIVINLLVFLYLLYVPHNGFSFVYKAKADDDGWWKTVATCDNPKAGSNSELAQDKSSGDVSFKGATKRVEYKGIKLSEAGKKLNLAFTIDGRTIAKSFNYQKKDTYKLEYKADDDNLLFIVLNHQEEYFNSWWSFVLYTDFSRLEQIGSDFAVLLKFLAEKIGVRNKIIIPLNTESCNIFSGSLSASMSPGADIKRNPPVISMGPSGSEAGYQRPSTTYTLKKVLRARRDRQDDNIFYFVYNGSEVKLKNLAIKVYGNGTAKAVNYCQLDSDLDDSDNNGPGKSLCLGSSADVQIPQAETWQHLINKVHNEKNMSGTGSSCGDKVGPVLSATILKTESNWSVGMEPYSRCINIDTDGYLVAWGTTSLDTDDGSTDGMGVGIERSDDEKTGDNECQEFKDSWYKVFSSKRILGVFCSLAIVLRDTANGFYCMAAGRLMSSLGLIPGSETIKPSSVACKPGVEPPQQFKP